ncbi:MAG: hypothetical protein IT580_00455 [Verrucomicrobiales bacterium]|nr:hypothetical protein [Verrucomicrobiales bacterium]
MGDAESGAWGAETPRVGARDEWRGAPRWGVALVLGVLASWIVGSGCGKRGGTMSGDGSGTYGLWDPRGTNAAVAKASRPAAAAWAWPAESELAVVQSALVPYSLWHSRERAVRWFGALSEVGRGGPSFLAYSSPTGIATLRVGAVVEGAQLRENWLLVGFAGAEGWTDWDSPWAVFLQRRPESVALGTNGVEARFGAEAGHFAMMPLYGYYKPPQKDRGVLAAQGLKEKELLTWEWPLVVARDPLTRLRYWAGATRWYPYDVETSVTVEEGGAAVVMAHRFRGWEIPDDWGTRTVKVAPVSPLLGLALKSEPTLGAEVKPRPFDFEIATPSGPYYAVPDAESVTVTLPLMDLVATAEVLDADAPAPVGTESAAIAQAVRERVRTLMSERFGPGTGAGSGTTGRLGLGDEAMREGLAWYARALPWCEPVMRDRARVLMRGWLADRALTEEVVRSNTSGGKPWAEVATWQRETIEGLWAYVHHTGDHEFVRERWAIIQRILTAVPGEAAQGGIGRTLMEDGPRFEPGLGFRVAWARLAYLARDPLEWARSCVLVGEELVREHDRWRGGRWVREQQPWHSMAPLGSSLRLGSPATAGSGWRPQAMEEPAAAAAFLGRAAGDVEVARFARWHLAGDLAATLHAWEQQRASTPSGAAGIERARIRGWLTPVSMTNRWEVSLSEWDRGSDVEVLAASLGWARWVGAMRTERLIGTDFAPVPWEVAHSRLYPGRGLTHRLMVPPANGGGASGLGVWWPEWEGAGEAAGWRFGDVATSGPGGFGTRKGWWNFHGSTAAHEMISWKADPSGP